MTKAPGAVRETRTCMWILERNDKSTGSCSRNTQKIRVGGISMKAFMDQDFLLETETAKMLYHDYAAKMPVLDYHCHISPQEIAES